MMADVGAFEILSYLIPCIDTSPTLYAGSSIFEYEERILS